MTGWDDPSSDPLGDIRALYRKLDDERRTVLCDPADVERVRGAFAQHAMGGLWSVVAADSPGPGRGTIWVIHHGAMSAALRVR